MFKNYINYVETTKLFQLEDIQSKYEIIQDDFVIELLKKREQILRSDKYIERIKKIFENSPVSVSNDFYAARIIYQSADSKHSNISMKKVIIIFGFLGLFIGIITALILNGVESRKLK